MQFKFTLEPLLDYRKRLEDVARKNWAEAQGRVDVAMGELNAMYEQIDGSRKHAEQLEARGGTLAESLSQIDQFITGQKIRIERQRAKIRELLTEVETKHEELVAAAVERKSLEKLKEKRRLLHVQAKKKKELKDADELVVTRFNNRDSA